MTTEFKGNFEVIALPYVNLTHDRRTAIGRLVQELSVGTVLRISARLGLGDAAIAAQFNELRLSMINRIESDVNVYENCLQRNDCTRLYLPGGRCQYVLTPVSQGAKPYELEQKFSVLQLVTGLVELLQKWAEEDLREIAKGPSTQAKKPLLRAKLKSSKKVRLVHGG